MIQVAALFVRADSVYKTMPGVDAWDIERDARNWPGGCPVVAHPPCRAWGRLRHFANPRPDEKDLAVWAVDQVRKWGGVLEHPAASTLWPHCNLPRPGHLDHYGCWTLPIVQQWWGHRAEKKTLLYVCGVTPTKLPDMPIHLGQASHVIETRKRGDHRPSVTKAEREHTPPALAEWLVQVARMTAKSAIGSVAAERI